MHFLMCSLRFNSYKLRYSGGTFFFFGERFLNPSHPALSPQGRRKTNKHKRIKEKGSPL